MGKTYRRHIRLNGRLVGSPVFSSRDDADHWYDEMKRRRSFAKNGVQPRVSEKQAKLRTVAIAAAEWLKEIEPRYNAATFEMYERLVRLYLVPKLGAAPISSLNPQVVKRFLQTITDSGQSKNTRHKVKVTLSLVCQREMSLEAPIIFANPAAGIKFQEKRQSEKKKLPKIITSPEDVIHFLDTALKLGVNEWVNSALGVLAGLRKSEKIALKWKNVDFRRKYLIVSERLEQASNTILTGTKNDQNSYRLVPMPDELCDILKEAQALTPFPEPSDFVICLKKGKFIPPRIHHNMHVKVAQKSNLDVGDHGLRHTFGAHFIANGGDIRTLKEILGHETLAQTDKYTQLSELVVMKRRNVVSYRKAEK